jgi:O-methyltransferase involved in polyketide biosynthesis
MNENTPPGLSGVVETLFIPLYIRAMESQRPDALIHDAKAVELVSRTDYDFSRIKQIRMDEADKVTLVLRNREFDRYAEDFLSRHPEAVIVHIGCGLDSRFDRVDNGKVEWYDLDVPGVIELRQKLIGCNEKRYHELASSAFDPAWFDRVDAHPGCPFLFLAEGVFMYFREEQVRRLVLGLRDRFPGSELVLDAFSPFLVRINNLRFALTHYGARYRWGLKRGQGLESWGTGICLLGEWSYFDRPEPRLAPIRWMRHIPFWARVLSIYDVRLGAAPGASGRPPTPG